MGKQLTFFETPQDTGKISQMIRSSNFHTLGIELGRAQKYNQVNMLIDLIHHYMEKIDYEQWMTFNSYYVPIIQFVFGDNPYVWTIVEVEGEAFYLEVGTAQNSLINVILLEWGEDDQWGDFNLATVAEKYILANRTSFNDIIKGTFIP